MRSISFMNYGLLLVLFYKLGLQPHHVALGVLIGFFLYILVIVVEELARAIRLRSKYATRK